MMWKSWGLLDPDPHICDSNDESHTITAGALRGDRRIPNDHPQTIFKKTTKALTKVGPYIRDGHPTSIY